MTLTIRSAAAELYALPWELLTLAAAGNRHLGNLPGVLLRYQWPGVAAASSDRPAARRPAARRPAARPRVALAWSEAGGAVRPENHRAAIAAACERAGCGFEEVAAVSHGGLAKALKAADAAGEPISIVHVLCHGAEQDGTFGLAFDRGDHRDGGRGRHLASASDLRDLVARHAETIRLVVLSACDSGNLGEPGNHLGSVIPTATQIF